MEDGQHGEEQMEGEGEMKMKPVSEQWEMEQLCTYELSRQRCKAAVWGGDGGCWGGASATQWSQISISETLIDTCMHKKDLYTVIFSWNTS